VKSPRRVPSRPIWEGLDPENDKPTRTDFAGRVALALGDMQCKGKVEKIGRGRAMRWQLRT